ncbi:hypothetical protein ILUMI_05501, partial [Ignelater luminosus]
ELESLSIDQVDDVLAEIPSDPESIDTDSDFDDDNIFVPSASSNKIQIYTDSDSDVECVSKPSISSKKVRILSQTIVKPLNLENSGTTACSSGRQSSDDEDPVPTILPKSPTPDIESSDYDSEDNEPLAQLQKKKPIVWKKVASPVVPMPFEEPHGPSIPDKMKYPHEVFLTLFTEDIVDNIVFQTNLYATQYGRPFIPTTKDEVSVSLIAYLQENKIYGCGTVRINCKFLPSDISEDKILRQEETDWRQTTSGILYAKWKDQRCISFLSNYHNPDEPFNVDRRQKDESLQMQRSNTNPKRIPLIYVDGLLGTRNNTPKRGPKHNLSNFKRHVRYNNGEHMPIHGTSRRCALCSSSTNVHRSRWSSKACGVALCLLDSKSCFEKFHLPQ